MKNRLREIREEKGVSQEKLAAMIGISRPALSQIENDDADPNGPTISKIVKATGVPANEIFFDLGVV